MLAYVYILYVHIYVHSCYRGSATKLHCTNPAACPAVCPQREPLRMSALTAAGALRSTSGMTTVSDDGRTIRLSALSKLPTDMDGFESAFFCFFTANRACPSIGTSSSAAMSALRAGPPVAVQWLPPCFLPRAPWPLRRRAAAAYPPAEVGRMHSCLCRELRVASVGSRS